MRGTSGCVLTLICDEPTVHRPEVRDLRFPRQNWHDLSRVWIDA